MSMFRRFVKDESGATAIEYGLIAALVSVAIIAALGMVGDNLTATFEEVSDAAQRRHRRRRRLSPISSQVSAASRPPIPRPGCRSGPSRPITPAAERR